MPRVTEWLARPGVEGFAWGVLVMFWVTEFNISWLQKLLVLFVLVQVVSTGIDLLRKMVKDPIKLVEAMKGKNE